MFSIAMPTYGANVSALHIDKMCCLACHGGTFKESFNVSEFSVFPLRFTSWRVSFLFTFTFDSDYVCLTVS